MAVTAFETWPVPFSCPGFVADRPTERPAWHRDRTNAFLAGGLRFEFGTHCAMCAGPGSAYFRARRGRTGQ
jgi:hypothetical protein